MPNPLPTKESRAFGERLVALLAHAKQGRHGAGAYLAERYGVSGVTANAWLDGFHKCSTARARAIAKDHGCTFESLYVGPKLVYLDGSERDATAQPSPIFTKERRASDDVAALQVGLESLVVAVLQRTQGSAAAFLEDVQRVAKESHFSPDQGFLGGLVEIARGVRSAEEAATQVLQRAGSGRHTRRGK